MYNILLDPLPKDWNGYPIDTDFQIGIMISQCLTDDSLSDLEKFYVAAWLLFPTDSRPDNAGIGKAINWYMTDFLHDNYPEKKRNDVVMDWDIDQWRIYAAFWAQYHIDLNRTRMHWFQFMGLLTNLEECAFTRVMDIRQKEITSKMSPEEKKVYRNAKKIYEIKPPKDDTITPEEQARINDFMKYANINKKEK
nr:MAG TPA: hypothetical protein [Caudoviricetes sp.]